MNRGQLIIDSPYRFFTTKEAENVTIFFNGYLNSLSLNKNPEDMLTGMFLPINKNVTNIFNSLNKFEDELGFRFDIGTDNNVFGFFPDLKEMAMNDAGKFDSRTFNKNNFGKTYKVLIPKGKGEYAVADATIGVNNDQQFFIKSLTPNKTTFLAPDASSRLRGDGKINELIVSKGSNGLVNIGNADYGEFTNRLYRYNLLVNSP